VTIVTITIALYSSLLYSYCSTVLNRLCLPPFVSYALLVLRNWGEQACSSSSSNSVEMLPPWSLHPTPLPLPTSLSYWGCAPACSCFTEFEIASVAALSAATELLRHSSRRNTEGARQAVVALTDEIKKLDSILGNVAGLKQQLQQQQQQGRRHESTVAVKYMLPGSPMNSWPKALEVMCKV
jgi:hypothetical protein